MNRGGRSMTRGGRRIEAAIRHGLALVLTLLAALASLPAFAHDIPADVRIQAFVKPEGQLLCCCAVPLGAMNEVDMRARLPDLTRADAALRVAELWIRDNLSLFDTIGACRGRRWDGAGVGVRPLVRVVERRWRICARRRFHRD